jgi:hypothetical protein
MNARKTGMVLGLIGIAIIAASWIIMFSVDMSAVSKGLVTLIALVAAFIITLLSKKTLSSSGRDLSSLIRGKQKTGRRWHIIWYTLMFAIAAFGSVSIYRTARAEASGTKLALSGIFALLVLLSGIAWFAIILRSNIGSSVKKNQGIKDEFLLCGFILSLTPCYGLLIIYRENAANPHLAAYAWQIAALAAVAAAFMFLTGFAVNKEYSSPAYTLFFAMSGSILCAGAQSSISEKGSDAIYLFYFVVMTYITGQLLHGQPDNAEEHNEADELNTENDLWKSDNQVKSGAGEHQKLKTDKLAAVLTAVIEQKEQVKQSIQAEPQIEAPFVENGENISKEDL